MPGIRIAEDRERRSRDRPGEVARSGGSAQLAEARSSPRNATTRSQSRTDYRQDVKRMMQQLLQSRLCGEVHDLSITDAEGDGYRLGGWCRRYYVKQMAQHIAGHLVSEGELVNDIQVRSVR